MKTALRFAAIVALSCVVAHGQAQYKVVWSFGGAPNDGAEPLSSLIFDGTGSLYGTTYGGGSSTVLPCSGGGCGTVFKLSPNPDGSWTNTILYSFCTIYVDGQCADGAFPQAGLVLDRQGSLYGTTLYGGGHRCPADSRGCGTAFKLLPPTSQGGAWTERVLYSFCSNFENNRCLDGNFPVGQLLRDPMGTLYGTTSSGGSGHPGGGGTVFQLTHGASGWAESVLYNFCSLGQGNACPDGSQPEAGVTFDKSGNLYGTTELGGSQTSQGGGTVYSLSPSSNGWTETVLYFFLSPFKAGGSPLGTVSFDALGSLYSTVSSGGQNFAGGVFRLSPKNGGTARTFSFDHQDGADPAAGVLVDSKNAILYGTTSQGGANATGTVFQIVAPKEETVIYNFCSQTNCADGLDPVASLIADKSGNIYGTTKVGGANNLGVVFEVIPPAPKKIGRGVTVRSLLDQDALGVGDFGAVKASKNRAVQ